MIKLALACLLLVACDTGGESMPQMPDAPPGTAACTGALYDWCATDGDCTTGDCHFFNDVNFTVCTQACSASNPCPPDHNGAASKCNNRGICKPVAPNVCALQ